MRLLPHHPTLQAVESRLPFAPDDFDTVNRTFARWLVSGDAEARRQVDIWTYLYVRQYFVNKVITGHQGQVADLDLLHDRVLQRIDEGLSKLEKPNRYSAWVSVICLNTFRNHLRTSRSYASIDDPDVFFDALLSTPAPSAKYDDSLEMRTIMEALSDLPDYLRQVARLRFVEGLSYKEMSARTNLPLSSLRAYAGKIRIRLQKNPLLRSFYDDLGKD